MPRRTQRQYMWFPVAVGGPTSETAHISTVLHNLASVWHNPASAWHSYNNLLNGQCNTPNCSSCGNITLVQVYCLILTGNLGRGQIMPRWFFCLENAFHNMNVFRENLTIKMNKIKFSPKSESVTLAAWQTAGLASYRVFSVKNWENSEIMPLGSQKH